MAGTEKKPFLLEFEKPLAELQERIERIRELAEESSVDISSQIRQLETKYVQLRDEIFSSLTPAQRLQLARHPRRPSTLDYIQAICDEWIELHGDRRGKDDPALVGGVGKLAGIPVVLLGHQKGRDTKDNVARNFGMAAPGGYRKAMRLMEHANRFGMPILSFIDTPGAWAGLEAEELGQGEAIAYNLREMFRLDVPIICTVIGEGGSGGALGIGVSDRLMMFEHAVYYVASPEACASILWKDAVKSVPASAQAAEAMRINSQAAEALKITAKDLKNLGILDQILPEPLGGAHADSVRAAEVLKDAILKNLQQLQLLPSAELRSLRYDKFRQMGMFTEG
ncbi:acetyl-CoA carboxylase carboxyltransferase subunit alpha [Chamaesiphon minutus]|uniref:Acetyl-coenzyme A carboxylase carboxyl transferase subunit alpha n=1 Tax=Chamaesiphon minutus (strain ATCC 27169 / PCC 6605) TaxID=1173020 RepID=K9UNS2_CHAP6|nr:acetyl-CoA carboxylase carboxyltransferase subunit alpha [Chamaesiphon minutus]AFY96303.1 acetyl-CoA carboxylase, carboxyl transferase, alpha subunit [Chamaesiphon minutus PCC 6605]